MASATAQGGGDSEQLDTRESMKTPLSFVPTSVAKLLKGAVDALNYFFGEKHTNLTSVSFSSSDLSSCGHNKCEVEEKFHRWYIARHGHWQQLNTLSTPVG